MKHLSCKAPKSSGWNFDHLYQMHEQFAASCAYQCGSKELKEANFINFADGLGLGLAW